MPAASGALLPAQNVPAEGEGRGEDATGTRFSAHLTCQAGILLQPGPGTKRFWDGKGRNRLETRPSFRETPHNQLQRPAPRVPRRRIRCFVLREDTGHGEQNASYGKTLTTALTSRRLRPQWVDPNTALGKQGSRAAPVPSWKASSYL